MRFIMIGVPIKIPVDPTTTQYLGIGNTICRAFTVLYKKISTIFQNLICRSNSEQVLEKKTPLTNLEFRDHKPAPETAKAINTQNPFEDPAAPLPSASFRRYSRPEGAPPH